VYKNYSLRSVEVLISEQKWIARHEEKRVITITDSGKKALKEIIDLEFWNS